MTSSALSDRTVLNPYSKIPAYQQLYGILRARIASGEWKPGDMLPGELELTREFGVSRITARHALGTLATEGLIHRQRGRGSFVSHPSIEQGLFLIINFSQDMAQRGFRATTKLIESRLCSATEEVAAALQVSPGEELVSIDRLRLADEEPMSIEEARFVHRYCPGLLNQDLEHSSLRATMEREYGITWVRARQTIQAVAATANQARLLNIARGAPLLLIERVSFTPNEIAVEFLRAYNRGDRYVLHNELKG